MRLLPAVVLTLALASPRGAAAGVLDDFEDVSVWSAHPAEGVELKLSSEGAPGKRALRVDFDFVRGGGYAVFRRKLDLALPENYAFDLRLRGECPNNDLEFKLVDESGDNVWWCNRRDFAFPREWRNVTTRKRQITFAWGPVGGGEIHRVAALEFAITAGSGGRGTVWLDELSLRPLEPPRPWTPPLARASSARPGHSAALAADTSAATWWASGAGDRRPWLELDLGGEREFGGLVVDWVAGRHPRGYVVEGLAADGSWQALREVRDGDGGRDHLHLPESAATRLRLRALEPVGAAGAAIAGAELKPLEWAPTLADFFQAVARDAPRGSYPRGMSGEQSYWAVVGVDGDRDEGLLSEDGALEVGKASFSVEPFLLAEGKLVTWAEARTEPWLEEGVAPIPSVGWSADSLALTVTAFADGAPGASSLVARYRVTNHATRRRSVTLFLAIRPFQVNPPAQFLNTPGGVSPIRSLARDGRVIRVNGDRGLTLLTEPSGFGALAYDQGSVVDRLRAGALPRAAAVRDSFGFASGAIAWRFDLAPGEERQAAFEAPFSRPPAPPIAVVADPVALRQVQGRLETCARRWNTSMGRFRIQLPPSAAPVARTLLAQIGWILVNRDGPAIQPGSRSYERSWIRDGALTSSALLRVGQREAVREFLLWFASHQFDNGKVPCCVDRRGPDPVPEHDSHGELIYLAAEYLRLTGDSATVAKVWPNVARAAAYLDSLRQQRRTAEYRTPERREFFGLLPPSISHEGYSAKPMHSYWDDFFALRGFADAAWLAGRLGHRADATRLQRIHGEFERDLGASIAAAMARHRVDYVPGCADLGDFDATSTTIALSPVQAGRRAVPPAALRNTFERYWEFFERRRDGKEAWEAYTPYEIRNLGAFVRLGWRDRAQELLRYFMADRRPIGWAQWPEVVRRDPREPGFLGDLPHTWVGSDFVRSVLDMLAYEREADQSLVVGAGVPREWLSGPGTMVRGLRTRYGALDLAMLDLGRSLTFRIEGVRLPPGGIVVAAPGVAAGWTATVNGRPAAVSKDGQVHVRQVPATVRLAPPLSR